MAAQSVLEKAMAQAEDAAANFTPPAVAPLASQSLVTQGDSGGALSRPSLDNVVDSAGLSVDHFIQVKQSGFRLGDMKGLFQEFEATIDIDDVVAIFSVRATSDGGTKFIKSYDGVKSATGGNFANELRHLQATQEKVDGPYETIEIPMTLTAPVTDGKVTIDAGTTIGLTPSITGVKPFSKFMKKVRSEGLSGQEVKVKCTHSPQINAKGNEWGITLFELLGAA